MPNGNPTAADYAWDAARDAQLDINALNRRFNRMLDLLLAKGVLTQGDLNVLNEKWKRIPTRQG
jgi:hypothetical protein